MTTVYDFGNFSVVEDMIFGWTVLEGNYFFPISQIVVEAELDYLIRRCANNVLYEDIVKACVKRLKELKHLEIERVLLENKRQEELRLQRMAEGDAVLNIAKDHDSVFEEIRKGLANAKSIWLLDPLTKNPYVRVDRTSSGYQLVSASNPDTPIDVESNRIIDVVSRVMRRWW